jgi:hypothetical protein
LVGKPEGRRPLRRQEWVEDNIELDIVEDWFGGVDWMCLAEVRNRWLLVVNM